MKQLELTVVQGGDVLDTVTLTKSGKLVYNTGRAKDILAPRLGLGLTPEDVFKSYTNWSNGYVSLLPKEK